MVPESLGEHHPGYNWISEASISIAMQYIDSN
jgi:hypothetical protein